MSLFTDYITRLRSEGDTRSPESVALALGASLSDDERSSLIQSDPEFAKAFDYAYRQTEKTPFLPEMGRSLGSGIQRMVGGIFSGMSAIKTPLEQATGLSMGSTYDADVADSAQAAAAEARGNVAVPNIESVHGAGDFARWAGSGLLENVPSMAPAAAAGVTTALISKNPTLTQQAVAAFIPSAVQNIGEQYQSLRDAGISNEQAAIPAIAGGSVSGALDTVGIVANLGPVLNKIAGRTGLNASMLQTRIVGRLASSQAGRRVLDGVAGAAKGIVTEGVPEALQEAVAMTVEEQVTGKPISDEEWSSRLLNAGVQGGIMGGIMGGGGAAYGNESNALINRGQRIQSGMRQTQMERAETLLAAQKLAAAKAAEDSAAAEEGVRALQKQREDAAAQARLDSAEELRQAQLNALDEALSMADEIAGERRTAANQQAVKQQQDTRSAIQTGDLMTQMREMSTLDPEDEAMLAARNAAPISPPTPAASIQTTEVTHGLPQEKGQEVQGLLTPAPQTTTPSPAPAPVKAVPASLSKGRVIPTPVEDRVEILGRIPAQTPFDANEHLGARKDNGLAVVLRNKEGDHIVRPVDGQGNVGNVSMSKGRPNTTATGKYAAKLAKLESIGWQPVEYVQVRGGKQIKSNFAPGEYEAAAKDFGTVEQSAGPAEKTTGVKIEDVIAAEDAAPDAQVQEGATEALRQYIALSKLTADPRAVAEANTLGESVAALAGLKKAPTVAEAQVMLAELEQDTAATPAAEMTKAKKASKAKALVVEQIAQPKPIKAEAVAMGNQLTADTERWFAANAPKAKLAGPVAISALKEEYIQRIIRNLQRYQEALGQKVDDPKVLEASARMEARPTFRAEGLLGPTKQNSFRSPGTYAIDADKARSEMVRALNFLQDKGFNVALFQQHLASELETIRNTGGAVLPTEKIVAITLADLSTPTAADIGSAFHEAAHPFIDSLPPPLRAEFQRAILLLTDAYSDSQISTDLRILVSADPKTLTDAQRAMLQAATPEQIAAAKNAALDPEEMALEQAVEYLAGRGFDGGKARTLLRQIIDAVKEIAYRVAYAIAKTVRGEGQVSQLLAREYVSAMFRNAVTRANEGTVRHQILEWFGASPFKGALKMDVVSNFDGALHPGTYDLTTGQMLRNYVATDTAESVAENIRIAEANEKLVRTLRGFNQPKDLPPGTTITVQASLEVEGEKVPGYVQIDFVDNGVNTRSTNPATLAAEGYRLPDFSNLPRGHYTYEDAVATLERTAADPRDREFLTQLNEVKIVRDKEGNLLAPNGKTSKLNEYQWKMVRTPNFKQWFGDWEGDPKHASKVVDPETGEPMVMYHGTKEGNIEQFDVGKTSPDSLFGIGFYFTSNPAVASEYVRKPQLGSRSRNYASPQRLKEYLTPGRVLPNGDTVISFNADENSPTVFVQRFPRTVGYRPNFTNAEVDAVIGQRQGTSNPNVTPAFLNIRNAIDADDKSMLIGSDFTVGDLIEEGEQKILTDYAGSYGSDSPYGFDGVTHVGGVRRGDIKHRVFIATSPAQVKSAIGNVGTFSAQQPSILRTMRPTPVLSTESPLDTAHWHIASANFQQRALSDLFAFVKPTLKNGTKIEDFLREMVGLRSSELPAAKRDVVVAEMGKLVDPVTGKAGTPAGLDPTMDMDRLTSAGQRDRMIVDAYEQLAKVRTRMGDLQTEDRKAYRRLEKKQKGQGGLNTDEQKTFDELSATIATREKLLLDQDNGIHRYLSLLEGGMDAVSTKAEKFAPVWGCKYRVPATADAKIEDVLKAKKYLKAVGLRGSTAKAEDVIAFVEDTRKVAAWVNNPENQKLGAFYNQMRDQYERMIALNTNERVTKPKAVIRSWGGKAIPESLRNMGLASARRIASRFFKKDELDRRYFGHCEVFGHEWLNAQRKAIDALGLSRMNDEFFQTQYMTPALRILNDPITGDARSYLFDAMAKRGIEIKPSAKQAFWDFLQQHKANRDFYTQAHKDMGLKVRDADLGIERRLMETGELTSPRRMASSILDLHAFAEGTDWAGLKVKVPKKIAELYDNDKAAVGQTLSPYFTPKMVEGFVRPLALDSRSHFKFWSDGTESAEPASVFHVRKAFADATADGQFDVVRFAERLHELHGALPGTEGQTLAEVMASLAETYKKLSNVARDISNANGENSVGSLPRQLMDARQAEDFPADWVEFLPLDPSNMRTLFAQMSAAAAFGRDGLNDGGETHREIAALRSDLQALRDEYKGIKAATASSSAIAAEFRRRYGEADGPGMYQAAKGADRSIGYLSQFNKLVSIMVRERGTMGDLNIADRVLGGMAAWQISAPLTSIVNMLDAIAPYHVTGLGVTTAKNFAQAFKTIGSDFLTSSFRDIGVNLSLNAECAEMRAHWSGGDPSSAITFKDRIKDFGMGSEQQKASLLPRYILRQFTEPLNIGVGDFTGPKKFGTIQAAAPKLKFLSLFPFTQRASTNTVIDSSYEAVKRLYSGAIKKIDESGDVDSFLRKLRTGFNPDGTVFELTPEDCGMGMDKAAFAYFKEGMASKMRNGTFERQVADAYERYYKGKPIAEQMQAAGKSIVEIQDALRKADALLVDDRTFSGIASLVMSEVSLEPGMGSDSPWMSNPFWRPLTPLLSFTIKAAQRFPRMFKDQAGQMSASTMLKGAGTLMLVAVPVTLAYSMVMDEFSEDALGKKADLRDPTTAMGALERLARYGVGGAWGEAANGLLNSQQGMRPFEPASRIMAFSKFNQFFNLASNLILANPPLDWANFGRPATQLLGANNLIQYMDMANQVTGGVIAPEEAAMTRRISVNNYLRTAGRRLDLDVRGYGGTSSYRATPISPWVASMERAALMGSTYSFDEAYTKAVAVAMEEYKLDKEEAQKRVKAAFQSRHPLRSVFKTSPTENQYRQILGSLGEDAYWVSNAVGEYNTFLKRLGLHSFDGSGSRGTFSISSMRRQMMKESGLNDLATARRQAMAMDYD